MSFLIFCGRKACFFAEELNEIGCGGVVQALADAADRFAGEQQLLGARDAQINQQLLVAHARFAGDQAADLLAGQPERAGDHLQ